MNIVKVLTQHTEYKLYQLGKCLINSAHSAERTMLSCTSGHCSLTVLSNIEFLFLYGIWFSCIYSRAVWRGRWGAQGRQWWRGRLQPDAGHVLGTTTASACDRRARRLPLLWQSGSRPRHRHVGPLPVGRLQGIWPLGPKILLLIWIISLFSSFVYK